MLSQCPVDKYLSEFVAEVLGITDENHHHISPIPEHLKHLFLRIEEYETDVRDQWDNWEHPYSENYQRSTLWIPEMDLWIKDLKRNLENQGIITYPVWPNNHKFAVCLTHDVDYISHQRTIYERVREVLRSLRCKDQSGFDHVIKGIAKCFLRPSKLISNAKNTLELCYSIEKECGVSASYFFTVFPLSNYSKYDCLYGFGDRILFNRKKQHVAEVMQFLLQEGFDIGLHGSYFSALEEGLLDEQKGILESALKAKIYTTRQHWLHWHYPITPKLQRNAGFCADSTLGYNRNIGFRAGTSFPFYIFDLKKHEKLDLLEVPLIIQDSALLGANALEYSPKMAFEIVKKFVKQIEEVDGCLSFLFHPDMFIKKGVAELYRQIIIHCLEKNAWVTNLQEIHKWWKQRKERMDQHHKEVSS